MPICCEFRYVTNRKLSNYVAKLTANK